jgi:murein DD-endopeptidase MepM/ murein hydrolase activator NlpD
LLAAPVSSYIDENFNGYTSNMVDDSALDPNISASSTVRTTSASPSFQDTAIGSDGTGSISTYNVKSGDNISTIAEHFGVSVNTILWANNIKDSSTIKEGTKLVILPVSGVQHLVKPGETLSSIATKYAGNASDIAQFNGLSDGSSLQVGSTIIIPGGTLSSVSNTTKSNTGETKTSKIITVKTTTTTSSKEKITTKVVVSSHVECADTTSNPCHGINGSSLRGFFTNPLPGALVTQGLHGWDAVDLAAPSGTPILAAAKGTVILSRMGGWNGGYGNYVILDNGSGVDTLYSHMTDTKATVGDAVSAGEVIGYVGMTGDATGDHLHFEVRGAKNPFASCVGGSANACFSN